MISNLPKVWFITGCSSGFGACLAWEALSRGDKVIATSRNVDRLKDLKDAGADCMQLDVTAPLDELKLIAAQAYDLHGRIDYLINNAGYVLQGTVEERTPDETQAQFDTNVFGHLNVTRAILPHMRAARAGVIANISSIAAWGGYPSFGNYSASKWALSGFSESLARELVDFGITVCCIEPGYFRTSHLNPGHRQLDEARIDDYNDTIARRVPEMMDSIDNNQPGDIRKGARVIVDVLTRKHGREIPLRLALGSDAYDTTRQKCLETLRLLELWKGVSASTDHDDIVFT